MNVSGPNKGDKQGKSDKNATSEAAPMPQPLAPHRNGPTAETQVNMVSPFAHPRIAKDTRFDLRRFVARHPVPIALSCLALAGGTIAAVMMKRRRRDAWGPRLDRLRQAFLDGAKGVG